MTEADMKKTNVLAIALKTTICLICLSALAGCAIVAISAESFRKSGFTEESRKQLLPPFIARFADAVSWVDSTKALAFASEKFQPELKMKLLKNKDKVKVIGHEILLTEFNEDATSAEVSVRSKFYRIPVYISEEKMEKQLWIYDGGGEWKLDGIEALNLDDK